MPHPLEGKFVKPAFTMYTPIPLLEAYRTISIVRGLCDGLIQLEPTNNPGFDWQSLWFPVSHLASLTTISECTYCGDANTDKHFCDAMAAANTYHPEETDEALNT